MALIDTEQFKHLLNNKVDSGKSSFRREEILDILYDCDTVKHEEDVVKYAQWIYWHGWVGNHDRRIDDAKCSNCGYKHPTVHGSPDILYDNCPVCRCKMKKYKGHKIVPDKQFSVQLNSKEVGDTMSNTSYKVIVDDRQIATIKGFKNTSLLVKSLLDETNVQYVTLEKDGGCTSVEEVKTDEMDRII